MSFKSSTIHTIGFVLTFCEVDRSVGQAGQLDRIEVESSESPAVPGNDTSIWSIVNLLAWIAPSPRTSVTSWNT